LQRPAFLENDMSPHRRFDRRNSSAYDHWPTLLPLLIAVVAATVLVIGS
jgi:hypothetical protein